MFKNNILKKKNKNKKETLTTVAVDENLLLPSYMRVVVLVADGYRQSSGHGFGWAPAVTHDDGDEELFLPLTVERPKSRQRRRAVQVVLEVEVIAVAIFWGNGETERWTVFWRVLVHGPDEGRCLVQPHYLKIEQEYEGLI